VIGQCEIVFETAGFPRAGVGSRQFFYWRNHLIFRLQSSGHFGDGPDGDVESKPAAVDSLALRALELSNPDLSD
jgi:hypothetical protein